MKIEIIEQKSQLAIAYREHTTMEGLVAIMDKGYAVIYNHLNEIGEQPTGAPYAAYLNATEDFSEFDLEVGFPIAKEVTVKDGVCISKIFEGKAVTATHKGSYKTLEETYCTIMDYVQENSMEFTGVYYDWYLNDPSITPEEELLTKVVCLIK